MAVITSATSGDYGTGATWVGGVAPVEGDSVVIASTGTALETFSTNTAGYAIGATAITLTGAVTAGSYVIGESVQFGSTDPNYYTITNWNSGTKVLTVSALIVAIPAVATLVKSRGHVVTIAGTHIAGDDTTSAFIVNGTLRASRVATSSLTVKGRILTGATIASTIDYGRLGVSDPIPAAYTATLILNYSASLSAFEYGLYIDNLSNAHFCGATKAINSRLTADLAVNGTSVTVDDITGWAVGDNLVFANSAGSTSAFDEKPILTITPGTGTTGTVTFAAVTYAHASNCPVGNRTSNVTVKSYDAAYSAYLCFVHSTAASNNRRSVDYTSFEQIGSTAASVDTKCMVYSSSSALTTPFSTFSNNFFLNCNQGNGLFWFYWNSGGFFLDNIGFHTNTGFYGTTFYTAAATFIGLKNSVFYNLYGPAIDSGYSEGGQGCLYEDNTFCWTGYIFYNHSNGDGIKFTRCGFHTVQYSGYVRMNAGSGKFINCNFGSLSPVTPCPTLWGTPYADYINTTSTNGVVGDWTMSDCSFKTVAGEFNNFSGTPNPQWIFKVSNKNLDPLSQEIYTPNGNIVRDNTSKVSGVQSLKMSPTSASNPLTFSLYIPAPTGKAVGVSGYFWRDTANVTTVTLSGLGITPSVYTASGSLSANEQFFVSGTQTTGTDGLLLLTFSTVGTSGNLWVDGVSAPQAAAIDFGEFGFWANGLPANVVSASYVSAGDVWNYLTTNITVAGSIGKQLKDFARNVLKIG